MSARAFEAGGPTVDPASGAGALLLRPLQRFVDERLSQPAQETLAEVAERFVGIDNDEMAVWFGNAILAAELLPVWARVPEALRRPLPRVLQVGNGLDCAPGSAGVVVMNPPFGRASLDAAARKRWDRSLYGHANWYGIFLHAAVERVSPGGLIGAVLPTSFLGGAYYQRLRRLLADEAPLVRLRLIDDRAGVFASGVLQQTCLAVFKKDASPRDVICTSQSVNGRVRTVPLGRGRIDSASAELPWLLPRAKRDRALIRAAAAYANRLKDFGWAASTGPLVWNRHKPQISGAPNDRAVPILWAADVETGQIRRDPARDHQRWIRLRTRDEFMRLSGPAVLVQRTTAPEQPRRLVAAPLTTGRLDTDWGGTVVVENHVNVLRGPDSSPLTPQLLARLLNTATYDRLYRCMTGTVAVSAYELEALPFPPPEALRGWSALTDERLATAVADAFV